MALVVVRLPAQHENELERQREPALDACRAPQEGAPAARIGDLCVELRLTPGSSVFGQLTFLRGDIGRVRATLAVCPELRMLQVAERVGDVELTAVNATVEDVSHS